MEKTIKIIFTFMLVIILVGCKSEKLVSKCSSTSNQTTNGYIIKSDYDIYADKDVVNKVVTTETITSNNNTILAYFEKQLKNQYKSYNKTYSGYSYKITNEKVKVVCEVTIDYTKLDMKKFIKDNPAMKTYVNKNNKLTVKGLKNMYKSTGASCQ